MNIALLTPQYINTSRAGESLGIKYIASFIDPGNAVDVFEPTLSNINVNDLILNLTSNKYDIIGISLQFSQGLTNTVAIIEGIKKVYNPSIVLGGHFATFHAYDLLSSIQRLDFVIMNEGELTFNELIVAIKERTDYTHINGLAYKNNRGVITLNSHRHLIDSLDSIPFPKRDNTSCVSGDTHFMMITSRGCSHSCSFCSVPSFYNKTWRARTPKNVVDEIESLVTMHNANIISFVDDNFIGSTDKGKERAQDIADEIVNRSLSIKWSIECRVTDVELSLFSQLIRAGLCHVNLGVESGNINDIFKYHKNIGLTDIVDAVSIIRNMGISFKCHFIMFNNESTIDAILNNIVFLKNLGIASFSTITSKLYVYKGTPEYYQMQVSNELIVDNYDYSYLFRDQHIDLIYRSLCTLLDVFDKVERAIDKSRFLVITKGLDIATSSLLLDGINYVAKDASNYISDIAIDIVNKIRCADVDILDKDYIDSATINNKVIADGYLASIAKIIFRGNV